MFKIGLFSIFLFLGSIGQEDVFHVILKGRNAFLGYIRTGSSKIQKIEIFPKGVVHGFGPKFENFPIFFYAK